jgi:hypothetical protein
LFGAPAQGVAAIVRTTAEYHPKNRNKKKEERKILTPIDKNWRGVRNRKEQTAQQPRARGNRAPNRKNGDSRATSTSTSNY